METNVVEAHPWDTLREGFRLMERHGVRHLVIRENDGRLSGILSDRDLRLCAPSQAWRGRSEAEFGLDSMRLEIAMIDGPLVTIEPEADLAIAASQMLDHFVSALPVMVAGEVLGIVTTTDLLEILAGRHAGLGEAPSD
jgi:acetoin utilization protein AcuB